MIHAFGPMTHLLFGCWSSLSSQSDFVLLLLVSLTSCLETVFDDKLPREDQFVALHVALFKKKWFLLTLVRSVVLRTFL
jgi:hypothetical protein